MIFILAAACIYNVMTSRIATPVAIEQPGGGGGTQVQRGAAPALRISRRKGSFLRPPHVHDFVKEGYFFVPRYEVWGSKSPYNPRNVRVSDAE